MLLRRNTVLNSQIAVHATSLTAGKMRDPGCASAYQAEEALLALPRMQINFEPAHAGQTLIFYNETEERHVPRKRNHEPTTRHER
jgi:hypothetical protein